MSTLIGVLTSDQCELLANICIDFLHYGVRDSEAFRSRDRFLNGDTHSWGSTQVKIDLFG